MSILHSLKLAHRLALGYCVMLALVLAIAALDLCASLHTRDDTLHMAEAMHQAADADRWRGMTALNISRTLALAKSGNNPAVKALVDPEMKRTSAEITVVQKALETGSDESMQARFKEIAGLRKHYLASRDAIFKQLDAGDADAPGRIDSELMPQAAAYMAAVTALGEAKRAAAEASATDSDRQADRARLTAVVLAGISILIATFCVWAVPRSVTRPLKRAVEAVENVAEGDLSHPILVDGRDEVSLLLRGIERMQGNLRSLVGQVRSTTDLIQVASCDVAQGSQDLSVRTERSAASLQQTASSMEQMSGTVHNTAEAARSADELATGAAQAAGAGGDVVTRMMSTMERITSHSSRIGDIIGVINGIAFQTNILALNAAVEAARAGEQGRGFAVVAGEVRSLAKRSAAAANEIKGLISESTRAVEDGANLAREAGASMNAINDAVQRVTAVIGEIRAASAQQAEGIGLVNAAVLNLDSSTQQNAALVEETAAAADSLQEQAHGLAQAVAAFRLAEA